ncbi:hypothetical protein NDU88_001059 [Pleurodeles waltl]|uniref:Secreted protein n=1 Tax=Pleurodeles waltl TaxID=8319 RepID=A0AAV7P2P1_PLEWA|nr:hypothetical protein NDU88_001059 [Pleurodeles waltl]
MCCNPRILAMFSLRCLYLVGRLLPKTELHNVNIPALFTGCDWLEENVVTILHTKGNTEYQLNLMQTLPCN